ncbi:MAG: alpha/beta fold hydrolase [Flavobacterium sp.]|nr:MAG: alpha/beta fold hydrolase [Flavobacterium sp.]
MPFGALHLSETVGSNIGTMKAKVLHIYFLLLVCCYSCIKTEQEPKIFDLLSYYQPEGFKDSLLVGTLPVLEDRNAPNGKKINLYVAVTPATKRDSLLEPIFIVDGGPGVAASNQSYFYTEIDQSYRRYHDIVYVDVRGTGRSNPLHCPEIQTKSSPQEYFEHPFPVNELEACIKRYRDSVDFNFYQSKYMVDDLEEVRKWLGYNKINLMAISFGGKVSLMFMDRYPNSINRVVLHAPDAPHIEYVSKRGRYSQRALDELFKLCDSDSLCSSNYPNLRNEFKGVMKRLQDSIIKQKIEANGIDQEIELRWPPIAAKFANMLYSDDQYIEIPYLVHEAYLENYNPILEAMNITNTETDFFYADGLWFANICAEDLPVATENYDQSETESFLGDYVYATRKYACDHWPVQPADTSDLTAVVSEIPTLLISGHFDPALPPETGKDIVKNLANGQHIIIPYMAHMLGNLSNIDCYDRYVLAYFDGIEDQLDMDCFSEMKPGPFKLPPPEDK